MSRFGSGKIKFYFDSLFFFIEVKTWGLVGSGFGRVGGEVVK